MQSDLIRPTLSAKPVFILFEEASCPELLAPVHWEGSLVASEIFLRLRHNVQVNQR